MRRSVAATESAALYSGFEQPRPCRDQERVAAIKEHGREREREGGLAEGREHDGDEVEFDPAIVPASDRTLAALSRNTR